MKNQLDSIESPAAHTSITKLMQPVKDLRRTAYCALLESTNRIPILGNVRFSNGMEAVL